MKPSRQDVLVPLSSGLLSSSFLSSTFFPSSFRSMLPFMASMNSRMPFPRPLPNSGSFPGPKMISTISRIKKRWVGCSKPSIKIPPGPATRGPLCRGVPYYIASKSGAEPLFARGEYHVPRFPAPFEAFLPVEVAVARHDIVSAAVAELACDPVNPALRAFKFRVIPDRRLIQDQGGRRSAFRFRPARVNGPVLIVSKEFPQAEAVEDLFESRAALDQSLDFAPNLELPGPKRRALESQNALAAGKPQAQEAARLAQPEVLKVKEDVALEMAGFDGAELERRQAPPDRSKVADFQFDFGLLVVLHARAGRCRGSRLALDDELRKGPQGVLVLGIGEAFEAVPCALRELLRLRAGEAQSPVLLDQLEDFAELHGVETALLEHAGDLLRFLGTALLQQIDERQRHLAFAQIAADGFPENVFRRDEVQDIVHELERQPEVGPVSAQLDLLFFAPSGQQRAQPQAGREQARGLAIGHFEIFVFRNIQLAEPGELEQLSFHHHLGQPDQEVEDFEIPLGQSDVEGLHVKPVAGQDARMVAPTRVGRGMAPPGFSLVNHVIVNERRGLEKLDDGAEAEGGSALVPAHLAREQHQRRPDPLAAVQVQVLTNLRDGAHTRGGLLRELFLDLLEVRADQVKYFAGCEIPGGCQAPILRRLVSPRTGI